MTKDEYVRELFKQSYNLYLKYKDTSLSDDEVKSYLSDQEKITKLLGMDKSTMDMLGIVDMLVEGKEWIQKLNHLKSAIEKASKISIKIKS